MFLEREICLELKISKSFSINKDASFSKILSKPRISYWSGIRSLLILPRIGEEMSHRKLKRHFGIRGPAPKTPWEHANIFSELARSPDFSQAWHSEMLLFSNDWFRYKKDKHWALFYFYLLKYYSDENFYWKNQGLVDMAYMNFLRENDIRMEPYLSDTLRHVFSVFENAMPAFEFSESDLWGPLKALRKVYEEVYQIKDYSPIFMVANFLKNTTAPLYYSFQVPTALVLSPRLKNLSSAIETMRVLQQALTLLNETELCDKNNVECVHSSPNICDYVKSAKDLPKEDPNLKAILEGHTSFCSTSPFFKGCLRITRKSDS